MTKIGTFQIQNSTKLIGRGLVALGQILDGAVKIGSYLTFEADGKLITLQISGVEMADNISTRESWVGLTFVYQDDQQKKHFEQLKKEQLAEIA
jgi:hypothetical protein